VRALENALRARVDGEVGFDAGIRAAYSTDASNYRQVPIAVVVPRSVEAAAEAVKVCRDFRVPILNRGGGTSLAGQCCNVAVVIDWSKYCTALVSVDVDAQRAIVEPGIVLDELNRQLTSFGLMFGPRPATHSHCTIGGMIGNNACGASAQAFGKTVDNVSRLEIMLADGVRLWVGATSAADFDRIVATGGRVSELYRGLADLISDFGDDVSTTFPDIPRRVSGYNLDSLLAARGFDVARALVGSESTLATVLRAELELVPIVPSRTMIAFGFPSIAAAADAAMRAVPFEPLTIEGLDGTLIRRERDNGMNRASLDLLPDGEGWLVVESGGANPAEARRKAEALIAGVTAEEPVPSVRVFDDPSEQSRVLEVREAALGASSWHPEYPDAWPGWEDSAVPPDRLGDYLRNLAALFAEFGFDHVSMYGHFGHGCVHTRVPFELTTERGVTAYQDFLRRAAELVVSFGGSLSGEHGDGQARGWLLPLMFGDRVVGAFRRLKALFDPDNLMNPGKIVFPAAATDNLRLGTDYQPFTLRPGVKSRLQFAYPVEGGFDRAALRCVGVGNCRSQTGGVMCPSYRATGDEMHSTRGRARLLFEMVSGEHRDGPIKDGWRSKEVLEALDLCLACKGCLSDCPVDVDMATYKAEFLSHHYAGRLRPAAHYTMGWLPRWARVARLAPRVVNGAIHTPGISAILKRVGGIDGARPLPWFAAERFTDWFRSRDRGRGRGRVNSSDGQPDRGRLDNSPSAPNGDVVLWPDTFSNSFHPAVARAAVAVLEDAGYRVIVPDGELCCGLTWISTGQLDSARRILEKTAAAVRPLLAGGAPLVSLEPSCTAVFRADAPKLCPDDPDVALLTERTHTLSELLLATPGWEAPRIDRRAVVQPHCHQHAVMGFDPDAAILERAGVSATTVGGCCGLAGNFGFEAGHVDVSVACAGQELLPAVEAAGPDALVLADGFSCRTQLEQVGGGRRAIHLAELLAGELSAVRPGPVQRMKERVLGTARRGA
jgi:FAD/FMN-containing dehydrogenase/Fe-S oxidoreductase